MSDKKKSDAMVVHSDGSPVVSAEPVGDGAILTPGSKVYMDSGLPGLGQIQLTQEQIAGQVLRALRTVVTGELRTRVQAAKDAREREAVKAAKSRK